MLRSALSKLSFTSLLGLFFATLFVSPILHADTDQKTEKEPSVPHTMIDPDQDADAPPAANVGLKSTDPSPAKPTIRIAFGSSLEQWRPQPIWKRIVEADPDAFIFTGDNIYSDVGIYKLRPEPERIRQAYAALWENNNFQSLRTQVPMFGTWDDHDYGEKSAGASYEHKEESKEYFLKFFNVPPSAPEYSRPGVYSVKYVQKGDDKVQIILLDTRTFRSELKPGEPDPKGYCKNFQWAKNTNPNATILGKAQWEWLEKKLREPATLRLIVSSIQMIPDEHCWEKWGNFPNERKKLFDTIRNSDAKNVVLISGDRRLGEISSLPESVLGYPLYEVTSSGLNSATQSARKTDRFAHEPNRNRVFENNVREDNFGLVTLDNKKVVLELRNLYGKTVQTVSLPLYGVPKESDAKDSKEKPKATKSSKN